MSFLALPAACTPAEEGDLMRVNSSSPFVIRLAASKLAARLPDYLTLQTHFRQ
jgi:hypothetical protein